MLPRRTVSRPGDPARLFRLSPSRCSRVPGATDCTTVASGPRAPRADAKRAIPIAPTLSRKLVLLSWCIAASTCHAHRGSSKPVPSVRGQGGVDRRYWCVSGSESPDERRPGRRARVQVAHGGVDLGRTDRTVTEVLPDQERACACACQQRPGRVLGNVRMPLYRHLGGCRKVKML